MKHGHVAHFVCWGVRQATLHYMEDEHEKLLKPPGLVACAGSLEIELEVVLNVMPDDTCKY